MRFPDWVEIAARPASPARVALLCACSFFRNRWAAQTIRSRSRRAVGGRLAVDGRRSHRDACLACRRFVADFRALG